MAGAIRATFRARKALRRWGVRMALQACVDTGQLPCEKRASRSCRPYGRVHNLLTYKRVSDSRGQIGGCSIQMVGSSRGLLLRSVSLNTICQLR